MADSTVLTVKRTRRKRPSFSPQKPQKDPLARAYSESPTKTPCEDFGISSVYHSDLSSLEFNEFSLLNLDDPCLSVGNPWYDPLFEYLRKHFGMEDMWVLPPFLVLRGPEPPDPADRPFTIAGCIAVWLSLDEPLSPFIPSLSGGNIDEEVNVEEHLANEFSLLKMPKPESLFALLKYFPGAIAISLIYDVIIVEFDEVNDDTWCEKVETLPCLFKHIPHRLSYSNGPLVNAELKRLKAPKPATLKNLVVDDSDYVSTTGGFNPGAMLCSDQDDAISAGVLVEKNSECRLTVAMHCWDKELKENPDKLGNPSFFTVCQADIKVGYVSERIGTTDIGLAKLHENVFFYNRFLDIDAVGKVLVPSSQISISDQFLIDSFATGRQHLWSAGVRVLGKERGDDFLRDRKDGGPPDGKYVVTHQGIYATNDAEILGTPKLRPGMCGSAIVRLKRAKEQSSCLEDGEICGIMHWADLAMKYSTEARYFCFAEPVDSLIDDGWKCVSVPEKRESKSTEDNPPAKRQRF
ncbi:hypothetical protein AJ78_00487 [Emergomyces pasteurianus Ep9510]|uniref:Uncharacterized protein n=1 Tax=Emergomyces pasteurianus Ep9510 TaxID=1447872 RepID=A0A1J9QUH3_9EURO|nr:hypothetical protein AJ78_00487 [Emergomyces pasteurianus Ep9510]